MPALAAAGSLISTTATAGCSIEEIGSTILVFCGIPIDEPDCQLKTARLAPGRREDGRRPALPAKAKSINRVLTTGARTQAEDSAQRPPSVEN
jgi:hypothetical protein